MSQEDDDLWLGRENEPACKFDREYTRGLYDKLRAIEAAQQETNAALLRMTLRADALSSKLYVAGWAAGGALAVYLARILLS